jgi:hypothetical protein
MGKDAHATEGTWARMPMPRKENMGKEGERKDHDYPELRFAWFHEYEDDSRSIDVEFETGQKFEVRRESSATDSFNGLIGVSAIYGLLKAYLYYPADFGSGESEAHGVSGGVTLAF